MSRPEPPAFDEPWQASAFALAVSLQDRGTLRRDEFAAALGAELRRGRAYWDAWLAALEGLLTARGVTDGAALDARTDAWRRAAAATPHGVPVVLDADPGPS